MQKTVFNQISSFILRQIKLFSLNFFKGLSLKQRIGNKAKLVRQGHISMSKIFQKKSKEERHSEVEEDGKGKYEPEVSDEEEK